jgi:hypothetical protein
MEPSATLIGGQLRGRDKWLGGTLHSDGCIYGVPGSVKTVLKIDPRTDEVTNEQEAKHIPCSQKGGKFKWLRGAMTDETGDMFGIPSNADVVFRINRAGEVSMLGDRIPGCWKWHGEIRLTTSPRPIRELCCRSLIEAYVWACHTAT